MRSVKRGFIILICMLLAVLLLSAAGCDSLQTLAEEKSHERAKEPAFLFNGDSVYIVSGGGTLELPDAGIIKDFGPPYLAGMLSKDNKYLYYLTGINDMITNHDVNMFSGNTLYMVDTQTLSGPLKVADNVYSARLSGDGKTLLYITDMKAYAGKLYRRNPDGESMLLADSAYCDYDYCGSDYYGASYGGEQIYYLAVEKREGKDKYTLCLKDGGQSPAVLGEASSSDPVKVTAHVTIDSSGTILYSLGTKDSFSATDIYIKKSGEEAAAVDKGRIEKVVNGAEEFFYVKSGRRYYKAPGCDPVDVGRSADKLYIEPYYGLNPDHEYESRFLLEETGDPGKLTELFGDGTKNVITEGYFYDCEVNFGFTCVAYKQDGALYTVRKKNGEWGKPEKRCDYPKYLSVEKNGDIFILKNFFFDSDGDSLYYIALENEGDIYEDDSIGDAYCISLLTGKADLLQRNVYSMKLIDDIPHTITGDYGAYRIDKSPVRLSDTKAGACGWLDETEGGYIVMVYRLSGDEYKKDIYFTEYGRDHTLLLEDVWDIVDIWDISALFS